MLRLHVRRPTFGAWGRSADPDSSGERSVTNGFDESTAYALASSAEVDQRAIAAAGIALHPFEYYVFGSIYPPLKAMSPISEAEVFAKPSSRVNLYVHIPFCDQYCTFCHFAKEINPKSPRVEAYLDALYREADRVAGRLPPGASAATLYVGGGTASFLRADQIERLFRHLRARFHFEPDAELTFELHPNLLHRPDATERLDALRACGVNRWVFGAQAIDDRILNRLNRGHSGQDVFDLLSVLRPFGGQNISIDLIFGLPFQTPKLWHESLVRLAEAGTPKFNIFPLMFKIGDPITRHYLRTPEDFADGGQRLLMHYIAEHVLTVEHGYRPGPVFYYSKGDGPASRQQVSKFETIDEANLVGLGVSAFGYVGGVHYYNECRMDEYIEACGRGDSPLWVGVRLDEEERLRRSVIQAIRSTGIDRAQCERAFGRDPLAAFPREMDLLTGLGLVEERDGKIGLTRHGVPHADGIGNLFVSPVVSALVERRNAAIADGGDARRDLFERFDYTPFRRRNEAYSGLAATHEVVR